MSIVRTESEQLAVLLRDLEAEADRQKHETNDPYWQGRADAFRIALLYLPSFLYMNEEETLSISYEKACELYTLLSDASLIHEQIFHDVEAFITAVERLRGTFKEVNPFVTFRSRKAE